MSRSLMRGRRSSQAICLVVRTRGRLSSTILYSAEKEKLTFSSLSTWYRWVVIDLIRA